NSPSYAEPTRLGAHARWKLKRVGGRRCGGDGARYSRNADWGIGAPAGFLLRRGWIQDQLWASPYGRRAPFPEEARHAPIFYAYSCRYARVLGVDRLFH